MGKPTRDGNPVIHLAALPPGDPCRLCETQGRSRWHGATRRTIKRILPNSLQICPICDTGAYPLLR